MNPYASMQNVNVNQAPAYSEEEIAAMQMQAMQDYLGKEQAYDDLKGQGYGSLPYFLGGAVGAGLGGLGGYQLGKVVDRGVGKALSPLSRMGGAALGGLGGLLAGRGAVGYMEDKAHPGLQEAKDSALADYYNASQYLEETGDIDPRLYERTRLMNRMSGIPQHPMVSREREYNEMLSRQKAEEIKNLTAQRAFMEAQQQNMKVDSRLKEQEYYNNLLSRFASISADYEMMEKLSRNLSIMDSSLEKEASIGDFIRDRIRNRVEGNPLTYKGYKKQVAKRLEAAGKDPNTFSEEELQESYDVAPFGLPRWEVFKNQIKKDIKHDWNNIFKK
jgi:hypothetical protein